VFEKVKAKVGRGGATVETTLTTTSAYPGGVVDGYIDIRGGDVAQQVKYVSAALVAYVEVPKPGTPYAAYKETLSFHEQRLHGAFELNPGDIYRLPLEAQVPLETPFNVLNGQSLQRCFLGVRTELEISRSRDQTDVDPIYVYPLPAHDRLLQAALQLGLGFKDARFWKISLRGSTLPFHQRFDFYPSAEYSHVYEGVELIFSTGSAAMEVDVGVNRILGSIGRDRGSRFTVAFDQLDQVDWAAVLNQHLAELA
jgi:sporulation-control protein